MAEGAPIPGLHFGSMCCKAAQRPAQLGLTGLTQYSGPRPFKQIHFRKGTRSNTMPLQAALSGLPVYHFTLLPSRGGNSSASRRRSTSALASPNRNDLSIFQKGHGWANKARQHKWHKSTQSFGGRLLLRRNRNVRIDGTQQTAASHWTPMTWIGLVRNRHGWRTCEEAISAGGLDRTMRRLLFQAAMLR